MQLEDFLVILQVNLVVHKSEIVNIFIISKNIFKSKYLFQHTSKLRIDWTSHNRISTVMVKPVTTFVTELHKFDFFKVLTNMLTMQFITPTIEPTSPKMVDVTGKQRPSNLDIGFLISSSNFDTIPSTLDITPNKFRSHGSCFSDLIIWLTVFTK